MEPTRRITDRLVVFGLGSNLGDRAASLRRAADALSGIPGVVALARSSIVETPPAGGPAQEDYLNAALLLASERPLVELVADALGIERSLGRVRPDPVRWGPRTIDLDLLWCSTDTSDDAVASVPHPRLVDRPFALQPLLELVPDARDPRSGTRYSECPAARVTIRRVGRL